MTAESSPVRIAMRVEGDQWVAYIAERHTMKNAIEIGRCPMQCVRYPEAKDAFIAYGQAFIKAWLAEQGIKTQRFETISAPEHERTGSA